jgi:hypothetical protein
MKQTIIIWVMLAALFFTGCEQDFPLDEEASKSLLTINCSFNPQETFRLYVSRSLSFNEGNAQSVITDADVELYEEGEFIGTMFFQQSDTIGQYGFYTLTGFYPTAGKKYKVKATHAAYGTAEAEDIAPEAVLITSAIMVQYTDTQPVKTAIIEMQVSDHPQDNYFRLNTYFVAVYTYLDTVTNQNVTATKYYGANVADMEGISDTLREIGWWCLFSDKDFSSNTPTLRFTSSAKFSRKYLVQLDYVIELQTLSAANYEYSTTVQRQRDIDSGESGEPVSVFNNVEGGYGIFCGANISRTQFNIQ